jgi:hypothetical protein
MITCVCAEDTHGSRETAVCTEKLRWVANLSNVIVAPIVGKAAPIVEAVRGRKNKEKKRKEGILLCVCKPPAVQLADYSDVVLSLGVVCVAECGRTYVCIGYMYVLVCTCICVCVCGGKQGGGGYACV